jgi:hypothetical protein
VEEGESEGGVSKGEGIGIRRKGKDVKVWAPLLVLLYAYECKCRMCYQSVTT